MSTNKKIPAKKIATKKLIVRKMVIKNLPVKKPINDKNKSVKSKVTPAKPAASVFGPDLQKRIDYAKGNGPKTSRGRDPQRSLEVLGEEETSK